MKKGIACIIVSAFGFALMAFFVRLADDYGAKLSCFQKGFFRNAVAFALASVLFFRNVHEGAVTYPSGSGWGLLLVRCVCGSIGIFANFYAISHIQVGEAMALNKTAPFFTVFFSWLFLREKATKRQIVCLVLAFMGALFVVKPGFRTDNLLAGVLGLMGGLGAGLAYTCVHKLGRQGVSGSWIVLVFSAFSCLLSVPFVIMDYTPMTVAQVAILLGAGGSAALGQFGITAAYRFAEPRAIASYDYVGVIFAALLGFAFFGQIPDWASIVGFVVILLCAIRLYHSPQNHPHEHSRSSR